jgi:hypothetical protein
MVDNSNIAEMAVQYALAHEPMASAKAYADRGRKLAALSDDGLRTEFISAFRAWAIDPHDRAIRARQSDVTAEYALRNQEPPYDLVAADIDEICRAASEFSESLPQERRDQIGESIVIDYLQAQQHKS